MFFFLFSSCGIKKSNNSANNTNSQLIAQSDICLYGCPIAQNIEDIIVVVHDLVKIAISKDTKFAKWVAYKVESKNLNGSSKSRNFKQDPKLDSNITLSSKDYKDAYQFCNYDRGHIAPLATFSKSDRFFVVNYLSNITTQNSSLNRTSWKYLKRKRKRIS